MSFNIASITFIIKFGILFNFLLYSNEMKTIHVLQNLFIFVSKVNQIMETRFNK